MKAFGITNPGLEAFAASEIEGLLSVKTRTEPSVVLFDASQEELALLCYRSQSLIKVCSLLEEISLKNADDIEKIKIDFTKFIPEGKTFRVKATCIDASVFSQELEPLLGEVILNQFKDQPKVSMDNPDVIVYLYVFGSKAYIGIDYAGIDLSKRDYRVFANAKGLKANVYSVLLNIADFKEKETLLDPFCLSGEVGIEAALMLSQRSPQFFTKQKLAFTKFMKFDFEKADKKIKKFNGRIVVSSPFMSDVRAAQKNAKLAGVEKEIEFTRQDLEWIDFKFKEKESVDKIVTHIQCPSKALSENVLKRVYGDFFFQIKELLSKKGTVVVLGRDLGFFKKSMKDVKLKKEIKFMYGPEVFTIAVLEKA